METLPWLNIEFIFSWLTLHIGNIFTPEFWATLKGIATILLILVLALIVYCLVRLYELLHADKKKHVISNPGDEITTSVAGKKKNEIWEGIRNKLLSDNQSEWRLAIIEADIYLDKVLDNSGYHGDTLGDKLKSLTENQLASINIAWEAHKVRNRIAHDGADFALSMPESRRVLSYYEIVFRDLGVIE
jgi:hypothetical protein